MPTESKALKAELEDGYGRIANLLLEALSMSKLNGKQMSICLFIIRRTYSWGKKSDEITLKEFALACDSSETYMSRQLKQLIEWNVIKRNNYSPGKVPEYEINTRVEQWDKGCLNVKGLIENIENNTYVSTTLEQKDKGCTIRQPLNKKTRQGLHNQTTLVQGQPIENSGFEVPPKESIKESTTTSLSTANGQPKNGSKIENENIPVADIGADPIQQDKNLVAPIDADSIKQGDEKSQQDLRKIENFYEKEIREGKLCGSRDLENIVYAYEKYAHNADFLIGVMKKAKEDYIKRYGKLDINSFNYFFSLFEEKWKILNGNYSNANKDSPKIPDKKIPYKKTRFHNFEQRSDAYTGKQLEDMARKKREQYKKKMEEGKT